MVILRGSAEFRARAVAFVAKIRNLKIVNMADKKIRIDAKVLPVLHRELKDDIEKKAHEKGWNENETGDFINGLLKV